MMGDDIRGKKIVIDKCARCREIIVEEEGYGIIPVPVSNSSKLDFVVLCNPCSDIADNEGEEDFIATLNTLSR